MDRERVPAKNPPGQSITIPMSFPGASEEMRLNVDDLFEAFVVADENGLISVWNSHAEDTFGWLRSEAIGRAISELIVPARNRGRVEQTLRQIVAGTDSPVQRSRMRMTALHRDGNEFEIEAILFALHSGKAARIGVIVRQAGRRTFTESEAEKRHQFLMDQLGECYAEMDLRGEITFINKAYCEVFGVSREAREGLSYKMLFTDELRTLFRQSYAKVYRTGESAKVDYLLALENGKEAFNEQSISLKRDAQGNPVGFMVIVRDCFERKQNEIELVKAKQAAEAASKAKGEFLANMSHEIRTPLNGVLGMLELIGHTNPTPEQQELLEMAANAAQSLLGIINDVLDFSKIEAGKLDLDCTEFSVHEIVAQSSAVMSIAARNKGIRLSHEVAPEVPPFVLGDPTRLKQVLMNLMGNAVKFTQKGEVKLLVRTEGSPGGKLELKFSVCDTGIGIPPQKQKLIFEPFSQADTSTTRRFGTGLGLTICSRIVELMGGRIWVESEPVKGSVFHFTAVCEVANKAEQPGAGMSPSAGAPGFGQMLKVLLAEDNVINQKLAVRLLKKLGHDVVVARNGIEVLAKLEEQVFDVVLMDVQMPEMDGFAATAAIRAQEEKTQMRLPIIAMTAHAMKGDRERCLEGGMDDYIAKPISGDALRQTLAKLKILHNGFLLHNG